MSEQLRRNLDDLDALVAQTATARGLPAPYVEKDFWVTEVLRAAAADRLVATGLRRSLGSRSTSLRRTPPG